MRRHPLALVMLGMLAAAAMLVGCGGDGDDGAGGTPVPHTAGAHDLLLRYQFGGGLLPFPPPLTLPAVSLFGDGRLVLSRGAEAIEVRLTEPGVQRLLRVVIDGGVLDEPAFPSNSGCADCPTAVFTANIDGRSAGVSVYALTIATPQPPYDEAAYRRIEGLARFLNALDARTFRPDEITAEGPYDPPGVWAEAFAIEALPPPPSVAEWPAGLPALDALLQAQAVCGQAGEDLAAAVAAGRGPFHSGGMIATVLVRPLLPDDAGADPCDW